MKITVEDTRPGFVVLGDGQVMARVYDDSPAPADRLVDFARPLTVAEIGAVLDAAVKKFGRAKE